MAAPLDNSKENRVPSSSEKATTVDVATSRKFKLTWTQITALLTLRIILSAIFIIGLAGVVLYIVNLPAAGNLSISLWEAGGDKIKLECPNSGVKGDLCKEVEIYQDFKSQGGRQTEMQKQCQGPWEGKIVGKLGGQPAQAYWTCATVWEGPVDLPKIRKLTRILVEQTNNIPITPRSEQETKPQPYAPQNQGSNQAPPGAPTLAK
jgi:hypothetical protein